MLAKLKKTPKEDTKCPVCKSTNYCDMIQYLRGPAIADESIEEVANGVIGDSYMFRMVICGDCGTVYVPQYELKHLKGLMKESDGIFDD